MIETLKRPLLRRLYLVLWFTLVTITLLESSKKPVLGPPGLLGDDFMQALGHLAAFSVLLLLLWWALYPARRALLVALVFCCVYGAATELLQTLMPDRGASLADFAVDCIASAAAALAVYWRVSRSTHN